MVALVFCTKLYTKLAVSLCSFSQFYFPLNFRTVNALVMKVVTLPLSGLFSNILLAIFDIFFCSKVIHRFVQKNGPKMTSGRVFHILFRSRVIYRLVPKNGPKLTCGHVFQHNFTSKANFKKSRARFFSSQILLAKETKRMSLTRPVFNLKALEFGAFFAYFHLFGHLKVIQLSPKYAKTLFFRQAFVLKKPFVDSPSGFKIRFWPYSKSVRHRKMTHLSK